MAKPARSAAHLNRKPDLSGGWHVEPASLKEMKRLYGNDVTTSAPLAWKPAPSPILHLIAMLFESADSHRRIYTDGRTLPQAPEPTWLGYSIGKWEGDTLVVQSSGVNNKSWLDVMGHPHSEALQITERYHRRDCSHLDVKTTFDDPKMYTRAFTIK